ncbi:cytochrome c-553 [Sulfurospirillum diekertiae]|uniref:Cytochrome c-553 n=1 Tax=Sulfurospirillum diekertiae TaxID=1854492 RepID=A0A290HMT1_9BACT|nr:c-type cytochrome [Sulfurospirillum diekertiae]ATB69018.1 cytochrome c-553 [Sulfurospirillum diekertiae]
MKTLTKSIVVATLLCGISAQATPLYTKCVACHGAAGEKSALNKSLIIKDMSKVDFIAAMKGYKDGSYGKDQKALMKVQVAPLSDAQIEEIASFITKK